MKIYVARHGETEWNVLNKVCGRTDVKLTARGVEQAKQLGDELLGLSIYRIISSPLKRAVQTADIISKKNKIPYIVDYRLIEQDYGIFEGIDRSNEDFLKNKKEFAYRYPQGESMMQVAYRTYSLIEEVREVYGKKNLLLLCHGGVARIIHTYFNDMKNDEFFKFNIDNCKLVEYELK